MSENITNNDEVMNRVNAWQAHPFTKHVVCPRHQKNLVVVEVHPGSQLKLQCLECNYLRDIPEKLTRYTPKKLMLVVTIAKVIFENPKTIDELTNGLQEIPEEWP